MNLSVQEQHLLASVDDETTVVGDIPARRTVYLDSGVVEEDHAKWCAWQEHLK